MKNRLLYNIRELVTQPIADEEPLLTEEEERKWHRSMYEVGDLMDRVYFREMYKRLLKQRKEEREAKKASNN